MPSPFRSTAFRSPPLRQLISGVAPIIAILVGFAFLPSALALPGGASAPVVVKPGKPVPETWKLVQAFPKLSFQDPLMIIPVPRSNQLCVITREGQVEFFTNLPSVTTKTLVLDLSSQCQAWNDCGLLGIAFHPDFGKAGSPNRGYFYVWYNYNANPLPGPGTVPSSTVTSDRLERFTIPEGQTTADPKSGQVLIDQTDLSLWHNGGGMFFGKDGFLYLTLGDEGGGNDSFGNSQRVDQSLFSGVIRIDVDQNPKLSHPIPRQPVNGVTGNYGIPNDNPWVGRPDTLEEFYAIGLRSPHRMTYDATTNDIFCGDVGQDHFESVDLIVKGGNYRWAYMEGNATGPVPKPATIIGKPKTPLYTYGHYTGNTCVIGGYVYRGTLVPKDDGQYIFGDNTSGRIFAMSNWSTGLFSIIQIAALPTGSTNYTGLSSFGYDAMGNLYACKMGTSNGNIYRLVPLTP